MGPGPGQDFGSSQGMGIELHQGIGIGMGQAQESSRSSYNLFQDREQQFNLNKPEEIPYQSQRNKFERDIYSDLLPPQNPVHYLKILDVTGSYPASGRSEEHNGIKHSGEAPQIQHYHPQPPLHNRMYAPQHQPSQQQGGQGLLFDTQNADDVGARYPPPSTPYTHHRSLSNNGEESKNQMWNAGGTQGIEQGQGQGQWQGQGHVQGGQGQWQGHGQGVQGQEQEQGGQGQWQAQGGLGQEVTGWGQDTGPGRFYRGH